MSFKRLSLAMLAAVASQAALAAPATGLIQFKGRAQHNTCTVSVGGVESSNTATVILSEAFTRKLAKQGDSDGQTAFTIDLKNCFSSISSADVFFRAAPGTTVTNGRLDNMAADSPARNVQLQISDEYDRPVDVGGPGIQPPSLWYGDVQVQDRVGKKAYSVSYYAAGPVTRGNVEAAVEYVIQYF